MPWASESTSCATALQARRAPPGYVESSASVLGDGWVLWWRLPETRATTGVFWWRLPESEHHRMHTSSTAWPPGNPKSCVGQLASNAWSPAATGGYFGGAGLNPRKHWGISVAPALNSTPAAHTSSAARPLRHPKSCVGRPDSDAPVASGDGWALWWHPPKTRANTGAC